jgi:XRE family transcriptional regulator, regulator of sulfur utilization
VPQPCGDARNPNANAGVWPRKLVPADPLYAITYERMATVEAALNIGPRVRALREGMDLSLRDLAERSGVSAPMLSQVERGETSPTLQTAARIAAGLELTLSQLLRLDEGGSVSIVRAGEVRSGPVRRGHAYEVLTPPLPGLRAELSRHVLDAGAATGGPDDPPMHEPGSREVAHVQDGALELVIDGGRHRLQAGDTVTFDADLPHHFENPGPGPASFLAVVSAGLRRS